MNQSIDTIDTIDTISLPYMTDFVCTYHLIDDENMSDALYRSQFIQAFGLDTFNDEVISTTTRLLYHRFGGHIELNKAVILNRKNCFFGDDYDSFQMLFSYHTFYLLHKCFTGIIQGDDLEENWKQLTLAI